MLAFYRMVIFRKLREFLYARQVDVLSAAMILAGASLASRVLGLIRDRVLAHYFTGEQISIYFAAFRFPDALFEILVLGALSAAFIPTFISYISKKKEEEAWRVASIVMNISFVFFVSLAVLVFVFALPFSRLIAPGFSPSEIELMVRLTRILLFTQGFFVLSFFLTGALKSYQRFLIPAIAPILYNLGIIGGTIAFVPTLGIFSPAWGAVIGAFMHFTAQLPLAFRLGFRPVFSLDYRHPGVRKIIRLAAPRVLELGFLQLLKVSELFFASIVSTASYAYLTFAQHLEMLPVALFGLSLADAVLPALSYKRASGKFDGVFLSVFRQIIFFTVPVAVAFIVLRIPLVRLAFGASKFTWQSTVLTGYTLSMFALGIVGQALTLLFVRTFYALQNTLIPVAVGIADVFLNIGLVAYFILVLELPVWGIALAFAISALAQAFVLWLLLIKKAHFSAVDFVRPALKVFAASLASGGVMYFMLKILDRSAWDKNLSFLGKLALPERFELFILDTRYTANLVFLTVLVGAAGILVYLGICRLLRVEEIKIIGQIWKRVLSFPKVKVPARTVEDER
ncbi:MAG TPA: murein biosynthesis integral membrane protein MurJ [candidate division WWE3 bacterium]|uniref:Probable lipid II flippase MurJ n=1 Tax=candidate division WWE3 bacterium TaxID=2053526 RepID=A0A7C1SPC1_UNCKA|nr:murein biosynthesis integral membrane protein MurJ [candidate division WWE3 bacterium]